MSDCKQAVIELLQAEAETALGNQRPDYQVGVEPTRTSLRLWDFDRRYSLAVAAAAPQAAYNLAEAEAAWEQRVHARMRAQYLRVCKAGLAGLRQLVEHPALSADLARWGKRQLAKATAKVTPNPWALCYAVLLLQSAVSWELDHWTEASEELVDAGLAAEQARFIAWAEMPPDACYDGLAELPLYDYVQAEDAAARAARV